VNVAALLPDAQVESEVRTRDQMTSISVIVAYYDRPDLIGSLLADLHAQQLAVGFEVVVVDDGSPRPFEGATTSWSRTDAPLRAIRQANAGPGGARHAGIMASTGDLVVVIDDDMQTTPTFLAEHLAAHRRGADVVLGRIELDPDADVSLFERFHVQVMDQVAPPVMTTDVDGPTQMSASDNPAEGRWLCTGNVSFSRAAYDAIGGFDLSLRRCEDRDLGIRFEAAGYRIVSASRASSQHRSDHVDVSKWRARNELYGRSDSTIAAKHPNRPSVSPWSFLPEVVAPARPFLVLSALVPAAGRVGGSLAYRIALAVDRLRHRKAAAAAVKLATLTYGLDYFAGVGDYFGGPRKSLQSLRSWRSSVASGRAAETEKRTTRGQS
jgi:GT2 family glycosyltransferase